MNKTSISYKIFEDAYYPLFDKMNNAKDTIFENMDFRPPVDGLYEKFTKSSDYQLMLEADSRSDKRDVINHWIVENVFGDAYYDVKYKLIQENETLPYNIEYKLNNSYELLSESATTMAGAGIFATAGAATAFFGGLLWMPLGIAMVGLSAIIGLSDTDRDRIVNGFKKIGEAVGKIVTVNSDIIKTGTRKEILASVNAETLADNLRECIKMTGWNPHDSSKLTRFINRITNSHKEYDYAQCVGTKLIKFYISNLDALYKILRATDVDDKVFQVMEGSMKRGALNESVFRNMSRLVRNKNVYRIVEVLNQTNEAMNDMIDKFSHSKDSEYAKIGFNLSKILDSELRNFAYGIHKDFQNDHKSPLNRRNGVDRFAKDENDKFGSSRPSNNYSKFGEPRTKFDNNSRNNNSRNPF